MTQHVSLPDMGEGIYVGLQLQRSEGLSIEQAREGWRGAMLEEFERQGKKGVIGSPFITVTMPCGNTAEYETFEDIPEQDAPCSCGDETHWFVRHVILPLPTDNA